VSQTKFHGLKKVCIGENLVKRLIIRIALLLGWGVTRKHIMTIIWQWEIQFSFIFTRFQLLIQISKERLL